MEYSTNTAINGQERVVKRFICFPDGARARTVYEANRALQMRNEGERGKGIHDPFRKAIRQLPSMQLMEIMKEAGFDVAAMRKGQKIGPRSATRETHHRSGGRTSTKNGKDNSGEDSDPDPDSDPEAARRAADVARIRILTGEKFSILEKRYWKMQLSERGAAL